ncbi:hypothetical protein EJ08DRAFT_249708 [Tothia fuscella]|uniref:Uncharacterized protein n=1 Tax=Tothia fuscella TaxID=1048955 RepID=A0A9P4NQQ5_9PEZI|nr:hypothetical protein EJ08DRAFT_249708 [Tothia fuscella]
MEHQQYYFGVAPPDARTLQNQPTSTADSPSDETMGEADEPPEENQLAQSKPATIEAVEFKKIPCTMQRKQSILTQTIHSSESESLDEDVFSGSTRAHSTASTWSRGSVASTADLTSDGHTSPTRTTTPSPRLPPSQFQLPPVFNHKPFEAPPSVQVPHESVDPLRKPEPPKPAPTSDEAVEAFMKRRRCITFACGGKKEEPKKEEVVEPPKPAEPVKRACMLKFVCPTRQDATLAAKPHVRLSSPPPPPRRIAHSPRVQIRSHRGSDSTVRNDSPKSVRKVGPTLRARRMSGNSDLGHSEATRFHEFASSEEEPEDWTQEATCHRSRLTIDDTLKIENDLRKLGKEAEDEAMEEEEDDVDEDVEEDDDDDDADSVGIMDSVGDVSDDGFASDDEHGFAGSDNESNDGSDYDFWVPNATTSGALNEHIRPKSRRSNSDSSIESFSSTRVFPSKTPIMVGRKRAHPVDIRPRTPDLPDSTDFVCGTLDEDRPLEQAYISCLEQRRAAKHKPVPQDIDPTFPASDPEMDEEDDDSGEDAMHVEDSDTHHHLFIHGQLDMLSNSDEQLPRGRHGITPRKRSPSPRRLRSPPPNKRVQQRSPPPARRLFGTPPKRMRSPPPPSRHYSRSPPPRKRSSFALAYQRDLEATPVALAQRPHGDSRETSSVPRNGPFRITRPSIHDDDDDDDLLDEENMDSTPTDTVFTRGAIDIVKGLEKKRQRRHEKLAEKRTRDKVNGHGIHHGKGKNGKGKREHFVLPGRGAERMREMGMELAALRGWKDKGLPVEEPGQHIISY